ncbi:MAG: hypothetical protein AB7S78_08630 [Candidatus Omnitrophota bacterium]
MFIRNRHIALLCNLFLFSNILILYTEAGDFLSALVVTAVIYIVPGLAWIGLIKKHVKDSVFLVFFIFVFSFSVLTIILIGFLAAGINPKPVHFLLLTGMIVNLGIILTRPAEVFQTFRYDYKETLILWLSLVCIFSCIFVGMKTIPEKLDLDGEHQGTAYGLIHELKPYLTSDDFIGSAFYFAHPPMTNLFNAFSIFLLDKTDDYKYFYDSAVLTEKVLKLSPGEEATAEFMGETVHLRNFNGQYFTLKKLSGNDLVDYSYTKTGLIEYINWQDQNHFFSRPNVFPARASNIFASLLVFFILYKLITGLTQSRLLGIVGGYAYIFTPAIFVRSCLSEHVAFTNCLMVVLAYQYFRPEIWENSKWSLKFLKYIPGVLSGLINQKIVVLVLPLFLIQVYQSRKERKEKGFLKSLKERSVIPIGFALGSVLFWVYGMVIDYHAFILSHVKVHLFDRLFHHNTLFAEDYPGFLRLWLEFKFEFPYLPITVFTLIFCLIKFPGRYVSLFAAWIFSGAILFSIVDWKQTNHLTQIVPPLLIVMMIYVEQQPLMFKRILKIIVGLFLIYSFWQDMRLLNDFSFYNPTSGW